MALNCANIRSFAQSFPIGNLNNGPFCALSRAPRVIHKLASQIKKNYETKNGKETLCYFRTSFAFSHLIFGCRFAMNFLSYFISLFLSKSYRLRAHDYFFFRWILLFLAFWSFVNGSEVSGGINIYSANKHIWLPNKRILFNWKLEMKNIFVVTFDGSADIGRNKMKQRENRDGGFDGNACQRRRISVKSFTVPRPATHTCSLNGNGTVSLPTFARLQKIWNFRAVARSGPLMNHIHAIKHILVGVPVLS